MKNNYRINGIAVVDLILKKSNSGNPTKYFLLKNGLEVKANKERVEVQCHKCGKWKSLNYDNRYNQKEYICQSCRITGKNNPFYGKSHKPELKARLSNERKGKWYVGKDNPMYGKNAEDFMSKEAIVIKRKRQSEGVKGKKNGMYGKSIKDFMTDIEYSNWLSHEKEAHLYFSEEKRQEISKKLSLSQKRLQTMDPIGYSEMKRKGGLATVSKAQCYQQTIPEKKVEHWLQEHNVDYDYSPIMGFKECCFQYDFIIHGKRILIEVQGDYWHGNPNIYDENGNDGKKKLNSIQKAKIERDNLKATFAKEKNFKLIYIWEEEINKNDFSKLLEVL